MTNEAPRARERARTKRTRRERASDVKSRARSRRGIDSHRSRANATTRRRVIKYKTPPDARLAAVARSTRPHSASTRERERRARAMRRSSRVLACALALALCSSLARAVVPLVDGLARLDDRSFERETQSASGSSSGDWLVLFTDRDSPRGARARAALAAASSALLERGVVAAEVDAEESPETMDRFRFVVRRRPSVVLLRRGKCYARAVSGEEDEGVMTAFGTETYEREGEASDAPKELTSIQRAFARATTGLAMMIVRMHSRVEKMAHVLEMDVSAVEATWRKNGFRAALATAERSMSKNASEYGLLLMIAGLVLIITAGALALVTFPSQDAATRAKKTKTE